MDPKIEEMLHAYEKRSDAERALMAEMQRGAGLARRDDFLLSVGPHTGQFLNSLARDAKAQRMLELGTSYGYSTVWLAEAARATGGRVTSLELQPKKRDFTRQQLAQVGLDSFVDLRLGDALVILPELAGPFDFVLVDLWKDLYVPCLELLLPKLTPGAFVVADNMISPEMARHDAEIYRRHLRGTARFDTVLLPLGHGIEVSRFVG